MKKYIIKSITDSNGMMKKDEKNKQRIGSMITMLEATVSRPLSYAYVTDSGGATKEGSFTGSTVRTLNEDESTGNIEAVTFSSIYKFVYAGEYDGSNEYVNKMLKDTEMRASITRAGVDDITCIDLDTLLKEIK
jgi:UDP-N-acetylglucosamine 2-epimerase